MSPSDWSASKAGGLYLSCIRAVSLIRRLRTRSMSVHKRLSQNKYQCNRK